MTQIKFSAYPKPWEIAVSKFLFFALGFGQTATIVFLIIGLCSNPISWLQILLLFLMIVSMNFCYKNVVGILKRVKDVEDTDRGE